MQDFLIYSIIASVLLTALINILPLFFPKATQKAERRMHEMISESIERDEQGQRPRVKVFFSWKMMLLASIVLTVLVNVVGYFAGR